DPDNNSVVLEGWGEATALHPVTEQPDKYSISLASAPVGTVVVDIALSDIAPDPTRLCLTSDDPIWTGAPFNGTNPFRQGTNTALTPPTPPTCTSASGSYSS